MKNKHKCNVCDIEEKFSSVQELQSNLWKIIAWNVKENEPIVICKKCNGADEKEDKPIKKRKTNIVGA